MFRLKAQHDKRGHDGTSHSEGVLQSKTTEESNQTQSEESNRDVSLTLNMTKYVILNECEESK